jgi:hypothetical protein
MMMDGGTQMSNKPTNCFDERVDGWVPTWSEDPITIEPAGLE